MILSGNASGLLSKTATNQQGAYINYDFTIENRHTNSMMQIEFDYNAGSAYDGSAFGIYIQDLGNSNTIYPADYVLPKSKGRFISKFITTSSLTYSLRFYVITTTTTAMDYTIDNVEICEESRMLGPIISNWTPYTPVVTGLGSGSYSFQGQPVWRRVGSEMEIKCCIYKDSTAGTGSTYVGISIPTGYTWATSGLGNDTYGSIFCVTTGTTYGVIQITDVTKVFIRVANGALVGANFPASSGWGCSIKIPIDQWSTNVNMITDFTEYASNDGSGGVAAGTTYNTGMIYGPSGSNFVAIASSETTSLKDTIYAVDFNKPILGSDLLFYEINAGNGWQPIPGYLQYNVQGGCRYGIQIDKSIISTNPNRVYIRFGNSGAYSASTSYAAAGQIWNGIISCKWRVRKVSNGNMAECPPIDLTTDGYKNYISNGSFNYTTTGWSNSSSDLLLSISTANILSGLSSGLLTKSAVADQGAYVAFPFTLDNRHKNNIMQIEFDYSAGSTYDGNALGIYVYDVTNGTMIYPNIYVLPYGTGKFLAKFYTSNSTSYAFRFYNVTTSAVAMTYYIDNIKVTEETKVLCAAAISNWTTITAPPIYGTTTNPTKGTTTQDVLTWRRVGDCMECYYSYKQTVAGQAGSGNYYLKIPGDYSLGLQGLSTVANKQYILGECKLSNVNDDSSSETRLGFVLLDGNATYIYFHSTMVQNTASTQLVWSNGTYGLDTQYISVSAHFTIPIAQWTSNINLATDFKEYASNSTTNPTLGTKSTSNYKLGISGSLFPTMSTVGTTSNDWKLQVQFDRPIQSTDDITLEMSQNGIYWMNASEAYPYQAQNAARYGCKIQKDGTDSAYQTTVFFGCSGNDQSAATSFGSVSSSWTGSFSTWYWRVRKISNGNMAEVPDDILYPLSSQISTVTTYTLPVFKGKRTILIPSTYMKSTNDTTTNYVIITTGISGTSSVYIPILASSDTLMSGNLMINIYVDSAGNVSSEQFTVVAKSSSAYYYEKSSTKRAKCFGTTVISSVNQVSNYLGSTSGTMYYGTASITYPMIFTGTPVQSAGGMSSGGAMSSRMLTGSTSTGTIAFLDTASGNHTCDWTADGFWIA